MVPRKRRCFYQTTPRHIPEYEEFALRTVLGPQTCLFT